MFLRFFKKPKPLVVDLDKAPACGSDVSTWKRLADLIKPEYCRVVLRNVPTRMMYENIRDSERNKSVGFIVYRRSYSTGWAGAVVFVFHYKDEFYEVGWLGADIAHQCDNYIHAINDQIVKDGAYSATLVENMVDAIRLDDPKPFFVDGRIDAVQIAVKQGQPTLTVRFSDKSDIPGRELSFRF